MYEKISLLISGHSNQIHTTYIPFHSIPNDRKKIYLFSIQTLSRSGFVQIIPVLKPKPIYRYWILENNVSVQHILNSRNMLLPWIDCPFVSISSRVIWTLTKYTKYTMNERRICNFLFQLTKRKQTIRWNEDETIYLNWLRSHRIHFANKIETSKWQMTINTRVHKSPENMLPKWY